MKTLPAHEDTARSRRHWALTISRPCADIRRLIRRPAHLAGVHKRDAHYSSRRGPRRRAQTWRSCMLAFVDCRDRDSPGALRFITTEVKHGASCPYYLSSPNSRLGSEARMRQDRVSTEVLCPRLSMLALMWPKRSWMSPAIRRTPGGRCPHYRRRDWAAGPTPQSLASNVDRAGSHGRLGAEPGQRAGRGRFAGGADQSAPGPAFRKGHGSLGQDGCVGCRGAGTVCGIGAAACASSAG